MSEEPRGRGSQNSLAEIRWITLVGSVLNLGLAVVKIGVGWGAGSQALVADGVHSFSDLVTDFAVWAGAGIWTAPADEEHPFGHGRLETLVNLFIAAMLGLVAAGIGWEAVLSIQSPQGTLPGLAVLVVALVSIVSKEMLYRWTVAKGRAVRSSAVIANAWHHRSDALSSIPVALAAVAGKFFPWFTAVDPVAALVVCVMLGKATWDIGWPSLQELMEANDSKEFEATLEHLVAEFPAIHGVHEVRSKRLGSMFAVDFHLMVDPETRVAAAHHLAHCLERDFVIKHPEVIDVLIHIEPVHEEGGHDGDECESCDAEKRGEAAP